MDEGTVETVARLVATYRGRWRGLALDDALQYCCERYLGWERERIGEGRRARMGRKRLKQFVQGCVYDASALERRHFQKRQVEEVRRHGRLQRDIWWEDRRVETVRTERGEEVDVWDALVEPSTLVLRPMIRQGAEALSDPDRALVVARVRDQDPGAAVRNRQAAGTPVLSKSQVRRRLASIRQCLGAYVDGGA